MLISIRIDDSNYIDVDATIQNSSTPGTQDGLEFVGCTIKDKKLSDISEVDLLGIVAECCDFIGSQIPGYTYSDEVPDTQFG